MRETSSTRIASVTRWPACSSTFNWRELLGRGPFLLHSATVAGCSVGELKQPRKGHQYAFRVDLQDADSAGSKKYVLSVDTDEEKQLWMSRLRAYTYLSVEEVAEVMQLAADVEAVAATSQAGGDIDDYGDDT